MEQSQCPEGVVQPAGVGGVDSVVWIRCSSGPSTEKKKEGG